MDNLSLQVSAIQFMYELALIPLYSGSGKKPEKKLDETTLRVILDANNLERFIREIPINKHNIYYRVKNTLQKHAKINTLGELLDKYSRQEFKNLHGIGRVTYIQTLEAIYALGLHFSDDTDNLVAAFIKKFCSEHPWEDYQKQYLGLVLEQLHRMSRK